MKYGIGIDPGWKNLGLSIVCNDGEKTTRLHTEAYNPSAAGSMFKAVEYIVTKCREYIPEKTSLNDVHVYIERYVAYQGVNTAESEQILMLIGALYVSMFALTEKHPNLVRAIDWKTKLVKCLFKSQGFQNPSDKLDKKFSFAAASAVANVDKLGTDHEADATCLAGLAFVPGFQ